MKSKPHRQSPVRSTTDPIMAVSNVQASTSNPHPDPIAILPTAGQPVSDTISKDILLSLCSSLHSDMLLCVQQLKVKELGERVDRVETSMNKFTMSFSTMVDAHSAHSKDISWLKDKVADMVDRSRQNNIKIRGVPESVTQDQLLQYTQELFSFLVPSPMPMDLIIDSIHRLLKPSFLLPEIRGGASSGFI